MRNLQGFALITIIAILCFLQTTKDLYQSSANLKTMTALFPQRMLNKLLKHKAEKGITDTQTQRSRNRNLMLSSAVLEYWNPNINVDVPKPTTVSSLNHQHKLLLLYNYPVWLHDIVMKAGFKNCVHKDCVLTTNVSLVDKCDAVLFHDCLLRTNPPFVRRPDQVWILTGWESPVNYMSSINRTTWRGLINWTMGYRFDSDLFSPVGLFLPRTKPTPYSELLSTVRNKTRFAAWFVSHCPTEGKREHYVDRLKKVIDVDVYGNCGNFTCRKHDEKCMDILKYEYKFYLAFENAFCKDYVTEKVFKVYNVPCIPVVRGGVDYERLVPEGTYINTRHFESPEHLGKYLKYLASDLSAYMKIIIKKDKYRALNQTFGKEMAFCELCYKMNRLHNYKNSYSSVSEWLKVNVCYDPTDI